MRALLKSSPILHDRSCNQFFWGLLLLVYMLQFLGYAYHHHDAISESSGCISCYWAEHIPPELPKIVKNILLELVPVCYRVLETADHFIFSFIPYLIPFSQAPPTALVI